MVYFETRCDDEETVTFLLVPKIYGSICVKCVDELR